MGYDMRDINWNNTAPADFTSANQLFKYQHDLQQQSVKAFDDAITNATKAIEDKNNALVNQYINSIGLEDWNKPETQQSINNFIQKMNNTSGGMMNHNAITDTLDKRQGVLQNREILNHDYGLSKIKHDNAIEDELVKELVGIGVTTDKLREDPRFINASPEVQSKVALDILGYNEKVDNHKVTASNNQTIIGDNEYKLYGSQLEGIFQNIEDLRKTINNPNSTPEQRELAQTILANQTMTLATLSKSLSPNTVSKAQNAVNEREYKKEFEKAKSILEQANENRNFELKRGVAMAGIANDQTRTDLAVTQFLTSDSGAKGGSGLESDGGYGGSGIAGKNLSDVEKSVIDRGYPVTRQKADWVGANSVLANEVDRARNDFFVKENSVSYNDFITSKEGIAVLEQAKNYEHKWFANFNIKDLQKYMAKNGYTDAEKIYVMKEFANGRLTQSINHDGIGHLTNLFYLNFDNLVEDSRARYRADLNKRTDAELQKVIMSSLKDLSGVTKLTVQDVFHKMSTTGKNSMPKHIYNLAPYELRSRSLDKQLGPAKKSK